LPSITITIHHHHHPPPLPSTTIAIHHHHHPSPSPSITIAIHHHHHPSPAPQLKSTTSNHAFNTLQCLHHPEQSQMETHIPASTSQRCAMSSADVGGGSKKRKVNSDNEEPGDKRGKKRGKGRGKRDTGNK
jgi:hypothetical protein